MEVFLHLRTMDSFKSFTKIWLDNLEDLRKYSRISKRFQEICSTFLKRFTVSVFSKWHVFQASKITYEAGILKYVRTWSGMGLRFGKTGMNNSSHYFTTIKTMKPVPKDAQLALWDHFQEKYFHCTKCRLHKVWIIKCTYRPFCSSFLSNVDFWLS